jgi:hypothetical protein
MVAVWREDAIGDYTMKTKNMYIESKSDGISGPARISRISFSKTGKSL